MTAYAWIATIGAAIVAVCWWEDHRTLVHDKLVLGRICHRLLDICQEHGVTIGPDVVGGARLLGYRPRNSGATRVHTTTNDARGP